MDVIIENSVSLDVLKRKMMTYRAYPPHHQYHTTQHPTNGKITDKLTIGRDNSMDGSTRMERRPASFVSMNMRSVVAQDGVRRLHEMRPEGNLVRHCAGGHEKGVFLAGQLGHMCFESERRAVGIMFDVRERPW